MDCLNETGLEWFPKIEKEEVKKIFTLEEQKWLIDSSQKISERAKFNILNTIFNGEKERIIKIKDSGKYASYWKKTAILNVPEVSMEYLSIIFEESGGSLILLGDVDRLDRDLANDMNDVWKKYCKKNPEWELQKVFDRNGVEKQIFESLRKETMFARLEFGETTSNDVYKLKKIIIKDLKSKLEA